MEGIQKYNGLNSVSNQAKDAYDKRYTNDGVKKSSDLHNKGYDWFNYPLTGKAPV